MLINDTNIKKNNCDKNPTNNNSYSSTNFIYTSISDENSNISFSTTNKIAITEALATTITDNQSNDQLNYDSINDRPRLLKIERSVNDSSPIIYCSDDAAEGNYIQHEFENESDKEQDNQIFQKSFTGSANYEEKMNEKRIEQTIIVDNDCGLSKLYLNDIEVDMKDEEQTITDLVNMAAMQEERYRSLRIPFGVILRVVFPLANGVVQGLKGMKDVRFLEVVRSVASSRQALTNLFAFVANTISLNLASVQVSHRIEPLLKLLKIRKSCDGIESLPDSLTKPYTTESLTESSSPSTTSPISSPFLREPRYSLPNIRSSSKLSMEECESMKCCTLNILAEPAEGQPIRADIVFIHGLAGSLANTWKQGLWENERRPVEFQRPPKPPVRPPKRPRYSRSNAINPPHHKKRGRFANADVHQRFSNERDPIDEADENNYSNLCGEHKDVQICEGIENSFPTFRLRMHDNGRLLQAEHEYKLQDAKNQKNENRDDANIDKNLRNNSLKPSPDDPNYSKCWPGDWLPIDCPGVRVIALNYTTEQHLWRPLWKKKIERSNLIQRAREMTELLIKHRVGYGHPIIWVGHSKGGLFAKQIIVDAWESGRPAAAPFWRSARGVFFYSTPHRGSHLASIKAPLLSRSVEVIDCEKNNKYLLDLHRRFTSLYHLGHLKIEVFSFVETALTLMSVLYTRIVGVDSADPGIGDVCGIRLDHREICKPRSRDCILYKQLVNMINKNC